MMMDYHRNFVQTMISGSSFTGPNIHGFTISQVSQTVFSVSFDLVSPLLQVAQYNGHIMYQDDDGELVSHIDIPISCSIFL